MTYRLNHKALERAKALVKSGKYVDKAWSFEAADSNAILGLPGAENWTEYEMWFLGISQDGSHSSKDDFAYPFGKGGDLYVPAIRAIISRASQQYAGDIEAAAKELLAAITARDGDAAKSGDKPAQAAATCDVYLGGGRLDIEAAGIGADTAAPRVPRFKMVGYTGNPMRLRRPDSGGKPGVNYDFPIVMDLDGMDGLRKSRPALKHHNQQEPLGHTDSTEIHAAADGTKSLVVEGPVSNHNAPYAQDVIDSSKNGFPWQASIGADIHQNEFIPAGRSGVANGRTYPGPVNIARRSSLGEISFVTLGADDDTSASIAASKNGGAKGHTMLKFKDWAKGKNFADADIAGAMGPFCRAAYRASADYDKDDPDGQEPKDAKAARDLDVAATTGGADTVLVANQEVLAGRIVGIEAVCHLAIQAANDSHRPELAQKIADIQSKALADVSVDARDVSKDVELATLRAGRSPVWHDAGANFNVNKGGKGVAGDVSNDVIAAAMALSAGIPEKVALTNRFGRPLSEAEGNVAVSGYYRNMGLQRMVGIVARSYVMDIEAGSFSDSTVKRIMAMEHYRFNQNLNSDPDVQAAGGFSMVSILGITENLMNKAMLAPFDSYVSVIPDIAYQTETKDFKQYGRYRLYGAGRMLPVNEAGEIKSVGLQDARFYNQLDTWAAYLSLTRKHVIDDDMGALTDGPKRLGDMAAVAREELVFSTLLAGIATLFPAGGGNRNYQTGALDIANLSVSVQLFENQIDPNNVPVNIQPDRLLVAPLNKQNAIQIFRPDGLIVTALASNNAGTPNVSATKGNYNVHKGLYRPIVSPWLTTGRLPGGNSNYWWLLPDPSNGKAIVQIGYLNGQRAPIIERGEAPFTTLGIQLRCIYDMGVAIMDPLCGQFSTGGTASFSVKRPQDLVPWIDSQKDKDGNKIEVSVPAAVEIAAENKANEPAPETKPARR